MAAEKQTCMILGAAPLESGKIFREYDPKDCFVICADGGYETAKKYNITPDLVVGDFDSAGEKPTDLRVISLPVEKDVTDTMFAVMKGMSRGFRHFVLLGCLGGDRFDHSLANLEVLDYLRLHGAVGELVDERTRVVLLRDNILRITQLKGATVSVFPYHCSSCTVTYSGLKYPLERGELFAGGELMGVSNSVTSDSAMIRVHAGTALVAIVLPAAQGKK